MNKTQISLVQESYNLIKGREHEFGITFYNTLFYNAPSVKRLFKNDINSQVEKLMSTLSIAINNLNNLDSLVPVLSSLGKRHINYGVKPEDYLSVSSSLIETFESFLGDRFSKKYKEAWKVLLKTVSSVMISPEN